MPLNSVAAWKRQELKCSPSMVRTRSQGYNGPCPLGLDRKGLKATLAIPVIANGDISSIEAAVRCFRGKHEQMALCALAVPWDILSW